MDFKILIYFFSLFQLAAFSMKAIIDNLKYYKYATLGCANFTFPARFPHKIGLKFLDERVVIRTFPSEVELANENTEYTKNMSMELESSCGSSKSSFDKTDVVMLTLIEKNIDNFSSNIIKSIRVDPLSVDFYPHNLTMKQFKQLVQYELMNDKTKTCRRFCDRYEELNDQRNFYMGLLQETCPLYVSNNCTFEAKQVDYTKLLAEMEKLIRIVKYLRLFGITKRRCYIQSVNNKVVLEMDNKTSSLFPKLTENHHFIVNFIDFKEKKAITRVIDKDNIIQHN